MTGLVSIVLQFIAVREQNNLEKGGRNLPECSKQNIFRCIFSKKNKMKKVFIFRFACIFSDLLG